MMGLVAMLRNLLPDSIPASFKVGEKPAATGTIKTIVVMIRVKAKVLFLTNNEKVTNK
ncbi:hypothetical protein OUHCRE1_30220 [Enterobacter asburiae]